MKEDGATALAAARRMSHGEQLARWARLSPDAIAFQFEGERRSYAALDERVTRLARALADRGVGRGDRVAVLMQNCLELVEAYFAACRLGAIAVPVNFRLVADEVAVILADADVADWFRGLPDDRCQVPRWGYVLAGMITFRFPDGEETYVSGDAYYVPPGHTPIHYAGAEIVEFSPTEPLHETIGVIMANVERAGAPS